MQAPFWHAEDTHGVLLPHAPPDEHVSTLLPVQRVAFGAHTPVQLPATQA
jgi:hypothetical protein